MKLLAIDTSSKILSVAIVSEDGRFCETTYQHKMLHAQTLMPLIEKSLESLELDICAIDAYAVSSGPGSFTGLRIGLSTLKAFAYAQKKPLILVNTLEAIAYQIPLTERPVCVMMDARNQQVYTAFFCTASKPICARRRDESAACARLFKCTEGKKSARLGNGRCG